MARLSGGRVVTIVLQGLLANDFRELHRPNAKRNAPWNYLATNLFDSSLTEEECIIEADSLVYSGILWLLRVIFGGNSVFTRYVFSAYRNLQTCKIFQLVFFVTSH